MLYNTEPTELEIITPHKYTNPLPEWGEPILEYVGEHILVDANTLNKVFFSSGNRSGRKKLVQLALSNYLSRYELRSPQRYFIAYSLGLEGMRHTKLYTPSINMIKAQELVIANHFFRQNNIENFVLNSGKGMLVGKFKLYEQQFSLWCPRQIEKTRRIRSLSNELPLSSMGLMVVAPNIKYIYSLIPYLYPLHTQIFFCVDNILTRFMRIENDILVPM